VAKMSMVKFFNEVKEPKVSELGGKGYSLAVLINNGFNVPKGFVIVSDVFFRYLKQNSLIDKIEKFISEINEGNFQEKSKEIRNLILSGKMPEKIILEIPEEITLEIKENLNKLNVQYISIRSSAVSEDSLKASFAGLHDTFLNVKTNLDAVLENMKKCWASLFNERAVIYRIKKGIPHLEGIAIVIQEMIPAEISGITFTVHPIDKKSLLVEASYGIGDMIVSGKTEPDDYILNRETLQITEKKIGRKEKMSIVESGKSKVVDVEKELAEKQVLSNDRVIEIAKTCLKVEKIFNYPQDIEWCLSNNKLWLLQSRAITGVIR
jgi:pyruvate,water dikinase